MEQNVTKTPEWSNDLAHFHVEELEERFENAWLKTTKTCLISTTLKDGQMINQTFQVIPRSESCPSVRITFAGSGAESWGDPIEIE